MEEDDVSDQVVCQRVRNRIIGYLELASSFEEQLDYQRVAPIWVPNEVINQWGDWVRDPADPWYGPPVFSLEERAAIASFDATLNEVCDGTPRALPPIEDLVLHPTWERLRAAAEAALHVFRVRGLLSEEEEI